MMGWFALAVLILTPSLIVAAYVEGVRWEQRRQGKSRAAIAADQAAVVDDPPAPEPTSPTEAEYAEAAAAFQREFNHDICGNCGAEWIGPKSDEVHRCSFCNYSTPTGAAS